MMNICVSDVFDNLRHQAPLSYALDFDNPGLLVGDLEQKVTRVTVALDATSEVIDEAIERRADLIVTHHPLIFHKLNAVLADHPVGGRVMRLIRSGISLICMHTNLDAAWGGVNDVLASDIGLKNCSVLDVLGNDGEEYGIGRVGELESEETLGAFLARVKRALGAPGLRYAGAKEKIKKVAVGGGACGSYLEKVHAMGCDAFVTADVKHDGFLTARELGITLIDAGHFSTENPICRVLAEKLCQAFPDLEVSVAEANREPEEFYTEE